MYELDITDQARDNADSAYAWIAENVSPGFAEEWYQGLIRQMESLRKLPTRCPVAPRISELPRKNPGACLWEAQASAQVRDSFHDPREHGGDPLRLPQFTQRA